MLLTWQMVCRSILAMPITRFLAMVTLAAYCCAGSAFKSVPAQPTPRLETGSILYAELTKAVDAKKAKPGDRVTAVLVSDVLAHGKVVLRHDSKLLGHVTEAQIHSKDSPESRLGIVFDKVVTKEGEVPFESKLLAIRAAERPVFDVPQGPSPMSNSAQAPMQGGHPSPQGAGSNAPRRTNPSLGDGMKSRDREIAPTGPTDIDGLSLSSGANGTQTIVSMQRTVKLDSGVKVELRVTGQ
jgi:hypothetical protein